MRTNGSWNQQRLYAVSLLALGSRIWMGMTSHKVGVTSFNTNFVPSSTTLDSGVVLAPETRRMFDEAEERCDTQDDLLGLGVR